MEISVAGQTHIGCVRGRNEDAFDIVNDASRFNGVLGVVADGMGGHAGGEIASKTAVESFIAALLAKTNSPAVGMPTGKLLFDAAREANTQINHLCAKNPQWVNMGTTLVVACITEGNLDVVHVGDSRCYLYRAGLLKQLTRDHSLVQQMIDAGEISHEQARTSPVRNLLTSALGANRTPTLDTAMYVLEPRDRVLLCSDGLTNMLDDDEMALILDRCPQAANACEELVSACLAKGAIDNVTVVIVDVA